MTRGGPNRLLPGFAGLALSVALASCWAGVSQAADTGSPTDSTSKETPAMKIRLTSGTRTTTATLEDNPASRDFLVMLPLTLKLEDYASTEKVANLGAPLSTSGAPGGMDPDVGDITYYAPWGNLAIFYRDFGYASGLVKLGKMDDPTWLQTQGSIPVTIEAVKP